MLRKTNPATNEGGGTSDAKFGEPDVKRILLLEDDVDLRAEIAEALEDEAFSVRHCGTIAAFWVEYRRFAPDLAVVDLNLPDGRGRDVVRELRADAKIGILVLSGMRDEADRVIALELGADDFVVKPCGPRELTARINAIIRRIDPDGHTDAKGSPHEMLNFSGYSMNVAAMELRDPDGATLPLTTAEFQLLRVFAERPNRVLSRNQLLDLLRGENWAGYDRTVDGLVSRLRKKIGDPKVGTTIFKTVHGIGYMFTPEIK